MGARAGPQWVIVVQPDRVDLYSKLRESFADAELVEVIQDRRQGERRSSRTAVFADRRRAERRRPRPFADRTPGMAARSVREAHGVSVYQARERVHALCPECRVDLQFELPRFVEPPARLDTRVLHAPSSERVRHLVELQGFTTSGRPILACRIQALRRV